MLHYYQDTLTCPTKQACWTSLQLNQNLRGPWLPCHMQLLMVHIAHHWMALLLRCTLPQGQTDRRYHFNTLAAYANCVITKQNSHTHPNSTHELSDDSRPERSEMLWRETQQQDAETQKDLSLQWQCGRQTQAVSQLLCTASASQYKAGAGGVEQQYWHSTKLLYVEPGEYWDVWPTPSSAGISSQFVTSQLVNSSS